MKGVAQAIRFVFRGDAASSAPSRLSRALRGALFLAALAAASLAIAVAGWRYPVEKLAPGHAASLTIVDRDGRILRQLATRGGGKASWVKLAAIPPLLVAATLAGEDHRFFQHHGVDALAILRALWLDVRAGHAAYGGSTISMQLVRLVEPHPRSLGGKLGDLVRALRLERAVSKQDILEQYLNRAYYGNGAYGVEAAARLYFGRPAAALSDGEATILAALPRAPAGYDPLRHLDAALARRRHLLDLLVAADRLSAEARARIEATPLAVARHGAAFRAPHFVDSVLAALPEPLRAAGGIVHTTLDGALQVRLEDAVRRHVALHRAEHLEQAGAVVLDSATGAVRALVGSADFLDEERAGQVDIMTTPRHPGSALKPFTYALALESGDTPATIALDVACVAEKDETSRLGDAFQNGSGTSRGCVLPSRYRPRNADGRQHGPVRYRTALACSYNLAAVHVAERVGIGRLLGRLRQAGLTTLDRPAAAYGPALTLGAGPVRLVDLAAAYGFLVNRGEVAPAYTVDRIEPVATGAAPQAKVEIDGIPYISARPRRLLFSETVSWLVMDMLADPTARRPAFGDDLPFDLPFPAAAKTGTSGGFADNVAVIATREHIALAWAGNFDGTPMHNVLAMWGAAPLARAALLAAADGRALTLPPRPNDVVRREVCALSGELPGPGCPHKIEHFASDHLPSAACRWHRVEGNRVAVAWPPEVERWARRRSQAGAGSR